MSPDPFSTTATACTLLDRVPKVKKTGNLHIDTRQELEREHLIQCITMLWDNPDLRGDCAGFLRNAISQKEKSVVAGPDAFMVDPGLWGKVEET